MSGLPKPWEYTASEGARTAHPSRPLGTNHDREGCHLGGDAGAAGLGGLTSSMAGRRGLSALTNAACCAAVRGSAGSPGEVATNASVRQHRDVGVPRNRPQQLPISHHLTTVIIISPDCPMRPPLHNLYVSAARFSSNQSLSASLCTMSSWRSPMHFRVLAAFRTATRQRTEVSKEDERQWDWTSTVKRSGEDSAEREQETAGTKRSHSAPTEADSSNRAKQEVDWQQQKQSPQQAPSCREAPCEDALWEWLTTSTATTTSTQTSTIATTTSTATQTYTISTMTSTATQTPAPETFQRWRGMQAKYLLELHKLRHCIRRTLDQIRDPRQPLPAGTPTSVLEQLRKRIKIITDDMTSVARSCCMEMAAGSALLTSPGRRVVELRPPKRSAPKRRRKPGHRRRRRDEKRSCSDTIEESISSIPPQRKRVRTYKGLPSNPFSRVTLTDSCHFHSSFLTTTTLLFPAPPVDNPTTPLIARRHTHEFPRIFASPTASGSTAYLPGRATKGMAGSVGEAANPGPATHERDWTDEQPDPTHRRINEDGDSVPSSQESVTRAVRNLRSSDSTAASMALPAPPMPAVENPRRQPRPQQQPREYLRCAQCGSDPAAHVASSDHGLMLHMGQKYGG